MIHIKTFIKYFAIFVMIPSSLILAVPAIIAVHQLIIGNFVFDDIISPVGAFFLVVIMHIITYKILMHNANLNQKDG